MRHGATGANSELKDSRRSPSPVGQILPYLLLALSGASALILEVLWLRELGVLFGNTAHAAATTLFVFFLGLSLGGQFWGSRCRRVERPLRLYGLLQLGIAGSALSFFGLVALYRRFYDSIFDALSAGPTLVTKVLLAAIVLGLPAFFMGGTLPAIAQTVITAPERLRRAAGLLYAAHTFGAAGGALLAGFYFPLMLGLRGSYLVALMTLTVAGLTAMLVERWPPAQADRAPPAPSLTPARVTAAHPLSARLALFIAFLSGFLTLGIEVLWTRLLAQVLNNSTYAFAAILVTYLVALAIGASLIAVKSGRGVAGLSIVAGLSGATLLAAAAVFVKLTHGLAPLAPAANWPDYVRSVFVAASVLLLAPAVLMGMVFPFLFAAADEQQHAPGAVIGRLLAVNSLGAIAGALTTGFVLLDLFGSWGSLRLMAGAYLLLGAVLLLRAETRSFAVRASAASAMAAVALVGIPGARPVARLGPGERLVAALEGSGGTVTVVSNGANLVMRLNNSYVLGDSKSADVERLQAHLPLLLHPQPRTVFFLGMGTGITAAAALDHPVSRVVVLELLPEVVAAARTHFAAFTKGLFADARVRIVADDGRSYLAARRDQYDVIVSDLFTPWHAGTGSLYTVEHFRTVRDRLRDGGLFAQWLPLYQMSRQEFFIVVHTLRSVFPQVTLWRGNFSPDQPIVALLARTDNVPLNDAALRTSAARLGARAVGNTSGKDHMAGLFYGGNLLGWQQAIGAQPINTDDRPIIEYLSPRLQTQMGRQLVGAELLALFERALAVAPPERDPVLARFPERERAYVSAGLDFFRYHLYSASGQADSAASFLARFRQTIEGGQRGSKE